MVFSPTHSYPTPSSIFWVVSTPSHSHVVFGLVPSHAQSTTIRRVLTVLIHSHTTFFRSRSRMHTPPPSSIVLRVVSTLTHPHPPFFDFRWLSSTVTYRPLRTIHYHPRYPFVVFVLATLVTPSHRSLWLIQCHPPSPTALCLLPTLIHLHPLFFSTYTLSSTLWMVICILSPLIHVHVPFFDCYPLSSTVIYQVQCQPPFSTVR